MFNTNTAMINLGREIERTRFNMYEALWVDCCPDVYEIHENHMWELLDAYVLAGIISEGEKTKLVDQLNAEFWKDFIGRYFEISQDEEVIS